MPSKDLKEQIISQMEKKYPGYKVVFTEKAQRQAEKLELKKREETNKLDLSDKTVNKEIKRIMDREKKKVKL